MRTFKKRSTKIYIIIVTCLLETFFFGIDVVFAVAPNVYQIHYSLRDDDGSETTASFLNTDVSAIDTDSVTAVTIGTNFRIRFELANEGDADDTEKEFILQYADSGGSGCNKVAGGSYANVPVNATTEPVEMTTTSEYADQTATTNCTATASCNLTDEEPQFQAGDLVEDPSNISSLASAMTKDHFTEMEFNVAFTSNVSNNTKYCFRLTPVDNYTVFPGVIATTESLGMEIVDSGGSGVENPSVTMSAKTVSYSFQTSTGTLGSNDERIRVTNTTETPTWSLSIAATDGAGAYWDSTIDYDYNDPTASAGDGSDTDGLGGQLTVDASGSTITPEGGCSTTGLTKGSSTAFDEELAVNSVTLLTAGATADKGCYWDLTGVSLSQTIPADQAAGSYSIGMTITIVAT